MKKNIYNYFSFKIEHFSFCFSILQGFYEKIVDILWCKHLFFFLYREKLICIEKIEKTKQNIVYIIYIY